MKTCFAAFSLSCVSLLAVVGLTGCAGFSGASFPDASINPQYSNLGSIQGSNYGGHAPLVGAHVYVLQPSVTSAASAGGFEQNAYGFQATSLLHSGSTANGFPTTQNASDPNIPTSWYYETTDSTGSFNISGDYTCVQGLPVYLYLYGGSPTFPSASNVFNITNISSVKATGEVTFTVSTTENAYIGEPVTFSNNLSTINGYSALDGATRLIDAVNLTTRTFSINVGANNTGDYSSGGDGGGTATLTPDFNPAVVNLAVLGNCPAGGFTGVNAISYVYVNEVSTVAAAYAFRPFTFSSNNDATHIGTSAGNVAGIQNAAVIAAQLYDITGGNVSTSYAGEGHIARTNTGAGNGIVPQANIDTLGNILAACVDSQNTATTLGSGGTQGANMSTQCTTLFANATNTGIPGTSTGTGANAPGTAPVDTATAAINIARHPGGPPYSYTSTPSTGTNAFVHALFNLPTGNVPFSPYLSTQPNDFTIGIDYTAANNPGSAGGSYTTGVEAVAIDKIGNAWVVAPDGGSPYYFYEISPAGVVSNVNHQTSWQYGVPVVDINEGAWSGPAISVNPTTYVQAKTTPAAVAGSDPPVYTYYFTAGSPTTNSTLEEYYSYASIADSAGNVYFGNNHVNQSTSAYLETFPGAATTPTVPGMESSPLTGVSISNNVSFISGEIGVDGTAGFFNYDAFDSGRVTITSINLSTGATNTGFPVYGQNSGSPTGATAGCTSLENGEKLVVTQSNDVIVPDFHDGNGVLNDATSSLYYIVEGSQGTGNPPGTCAQISAATLQVGLDSPWAGTADGNDYIYIVNRGGNNISVVNTNSGSAAGTVGVSPSTGFYPQYLVSGTLTDMLNNPFYAAVGPSGEMWVTSPGNNSLVEIIGLASPVTTPLSFASTFQTSANGGIARRP